MNSTKQNSTGPFDLGSENPDRSRSATNSPVNRESTDVAPPPPPPPLFLSFQSWFEKGKIEREGLSSVPEEINFPREASHSSFFFFFFLTICTYLHIYNIPSRLGLVVHLLGSHYRSQVEKLRVSPGNILQIELGEGVVRFPVAG